RSNSLSSTNLRTFSDPTMNTGLPEPIRESISDTYFVAQNAVNSGSSGGKLLVRLTTRSTEKSVSKTLDDFSQTSNLPKIPAQDKGVVAAAGLIVGLVGAKAGNLQVTVLNAADKAALMNAGVLPKGSIVRDYNSLNIHEQAAFIAGLPE